MEVKSAELKGRVKRMLPARKKICSIGFENMNDFMLISFKQSGTENLISQ